MTVTLSTSAVVSLALIATLSQVVACLFMFWMNVLLSRYVRRDNIRAALSPAGRELRRDDARIEADAAAQATAGAIRGLRQDGVTW